MKKTIGPLILGLIIGAAALYIVRGKPGLPNRASAVTTSFDGVAAQLESGGDAYGYYNVGRIFPLVDEIAKFVAEALPGEAGKKAGGWEQVSAVLKQVGLREIDGLGFSSATIAKDLFRTRMVVHHARGRAEGLIWSVMNSESRDLEILRRLPAQTALASMSDVSLEKVWDSLKTFFPKDPAGKTDLSKGMADLEAKGIPIQKMIASVQGPSGYILTLDAQKKVAIPAGERLIEIPEPGLALFLSVKDSAVFDFLKSQIPGASFSEKDGAKRLQIAGLPLPFPLTPTIVQKDGLLVAATAEGLADHLTGAEKSGKLADTKEFRALSSGLPMNGAGFAYVAPGLMSTILDIVGKMAPPKKAETDKPDVLAMVRKAFPVDLAVLGVTQNGPEGIVIVMNHTVAMEKLFLLQLAPLMMWSQAAAPQLMKPAGPNVK